MLLYRCVGLNEMNNLIGYSGECKVIMGNYNLSTEEQSTGNMIGAISFFCEPYLWLDSRHKVVVICDIPEDRLQFGKGVYFAAKGFEKTKVWTGRRGSVRYELDEAYTASYSITDVKGMSVWNGFNRDYQNRYYNRYLELGICPLTLVKDDKGIIHIEQMKNFIYRM